MNQLIWEKNTFLVHGRSVRLPCSKACEHAHRLAKTLQRTLRALGVLPARAIDSLAQMQAVFAGVPVLSCSMPRSAPGTGRRPW